MLNKGFLAAVGIGLVVVAIFVGLVVLKQQGATPRLVGEITNVRTLGMDQSSSVAIVDFTFTNDSRYPFLVNSSDMFIVDANGETRKGAIVAASNANQLFELFPALGPRTADTLIIKTKIPPQTSRPAMLTARFEIPKAELDARQKIILTIHEVDGPVSELSR